MSADDMVQTLKEAVNNDYEYEFWTDAARLAPGELPSITKLVARNPMKLPTSTVDELKRRANSNLPGRFHIQQRGIYWDYKTQLLQVRLSSGWVLRWEEWAVTPELYLGDRADQQVRCSPVDFIPSVTTLRRVPGLPPPGYRQVALLTTQATPGLVGFGRTP